MSEASRKPRLRYSLPEWAGILGLILASASLLLQWWDARVTQITVGDVAIKSLGGDYIAAVIRLDHVSGPGTSVWGISLRMPFSRRDPIPGDVLAPPDSSGRRHSGISRAIGGFGDLPFFWRSDVYGVEVPCVVCRDRQCEDPATDAERTDDRTGQWIDPGGFAACIAVLGQAASSRLFPLEVDVSRASLGYEVTRGGLQSLPVGDRIAAAVMGSGNQ